MAATVQGIHEGLDVHGSRPAANAAGQPYGALYSCSTHSLIYKTDGSTWATYASLVGTGLTDTGVITYLDGTVAAAPGTPAAGKLRIYAKTGKALAVKDDAGVETVFGATATITTKDEGSTLSTGVTTIDFVGAGVTATGAGATTTVTIAGGGGGSALAFVYLATIAR